MVGLLAIEALLGGQDGESGPVLLAVEALFLKGGDQGAVDEGG